MSSTMLRVAVAALAVTVTALFARESDTPKCRVIVNAANPARTMKKEEIARLFLKKTTRWVDGGNVQPVDQFEMAPVRQTFSKTVLDRTVLSIKSYWQQRIFSGTDVPPPELASDDEVVAYVKSHPNAIGYVTSSRKSEQGVAFLTIEAPP